MQDGSERRDVEEATDEENSRPQKAGEAATTRFGMEDGDNSDVPATGGPAPDQEASERST
ncbi:MAG: hypothetical protein M3Q08_10370 [Pseudomonadota bacterium]|nr:hypothetical protein [Pseudomonadota bacterium]